MPTYVYRCPQCKFEVEEQRKIDDRDKVPFCSSCIEPDTKCFQPMERVMFPEKSNVTHIYKGTGFYTTDYTNYRKAIKGDN